MSTSDERLDEMEIDTIEHHAHGLCASTDPAGEQVLGEMLLLAAAELRQRRAADLSAEDVELLRCARDSVSHRRYRVADIDVAGELASELTACLAVLDRLIRGRS